MNVVACSQAKIEVLNYTFLHVVSGRGLACQQEISLVLAKTPPIHCYTMMDRALNNYVG